MASDVIQLRPEVEEIVREIAARPDSVLLRVPRGGVLRAFHDDRCGAGTWDSSLSRAEKHLLGVHREEVAYALRAAAWHRVAESQRGRIWVSRRIRPGPPLDVPAETRVAMQASAASREANSVMVSGPWTELLESCAVPDARQWPEPAALCAAAHGLVPTWNGRMLASLSYLLAAELDAAMTTAFDALRSAASREQMAISYSNMAGILELKGDVPGAVLANSHALTLDSSLIPAQVARVSYYIQLGDPRRALYAAQVVEQVLVTDSAIVEENLRRFTAVDAAHRRNWSSQASAAIRSLRGKVGPHAGRLIDAFE